MSSLWVFGKKWQTLHEQLVRFDILWKRQVAASLWAACGFLATSGGLFMISLCALIFFEDSRWRSLHEQLVCHWYLWKNNKRRSLHEKLVCYWHLWKEASGGLFIWATCVSPIICYFNNKWRLFWEVGSSTTNGISFEKFSHQQQMASLLRSLLIDNKWYHF